LSNNIIIGSRIIGALHKPLVVAEISANHNGSLQRAKDIITAAAYAGADAVKLQTFTPDSMTMRGAYTIPADNELWGGMDLYTLYQKACTPLEWHKELFQWASDLGLLIFSTPFDEDAVDFLTTLNVPAFKIASFENTDYPLLKKIASSGKPVIMSTGATTLSQLATSVEVLRSNGCNELILLKCVSAYPSDCSDTNLKTLPVLQRLFNCNVGLSDHSMGIGAAICAVAFGATMIEKHFTLEDDEESPDSAFSIQPHELQRLVIEVNNAYKAIGQVDFAIKEKELSGLAFKRSLYAIEDIKENESFTKYNIKVLRPSLGLEPKYYDMVLGKSAKTFIQKGTPILWTHIL